MGLLSNYYKIIFWASTPLLLSVRLKENICLVGHSAEKKTEIFFYSPSPLPLKIQIVRPLPWTSSEGGGGLVYIFFNPLRAPQTNNWRSPVKQKSNQNKQIATFLLPKPQKIFLLTYMASFILPQLATCNINFHDRNKIPSRWVFPPLFCFFSPWEGGPGVLPTMTYIRRLHQTKRGTCF